MGVVYEHVLDYNVTAGVGQFNGSYVHEYIGNLQNREAGYPYTVVPYWMQAIVNNLVTSPMHSVASIPVPVAARTYQHESLAPTDHPSAPVIQITNASSTQLDFRNDINQEDPFSGEDCNVYGADTSWVGIRFCVSTSTTANGSFAAGLYICPGGVWNDTCELGSASFYPNLTSTFSVFSRKTTSIVARSNMSIVSVTSSGPPTLNPSLDLENFRAAIDWILDFNASNIPSPTSIAQQFFSGRDQLQSAYWSPILIQTFHSILAFPFWFFNPNNFGNIEGYGTGITPNLPPEFYITASVAVPHTKIIISTAMFTTFLTLQVILHLFIWALFAWLCITYPRLPVITSYPLFNFAFKARLKLDITSPGRDQFSQVLGKGIEPSKIIRASDGDVLSILEYCTHTLRSTNKDLPLTGNQSQQGV
ncbi:hypothetical protein BJX70DRAFT_394076 [Aspergillus crustosus]